MKTIARILGLFFLAGIIVNAQPLPRGTPEAQGVSSAALREFVTSLNQIDGLHGVVVARHGQVIAEGWWNPYAAQHEHMLYSLSKSFTSTAVGLAIADGKLSLDDEVLNFFPDDAPEHISDNLRAMRVRDLLIMSTGHQDEPPIAPEVISAKTFLAQPVPHLPGTHFKYNTAATFMLSAIVQKVTGETVLDYLRPRLFAPLDIQSPVWETNYQGISLGGYGLRVRTEDLAKFGQLYLQRGSWHGQPLLPAAWVNQATSRQTSNGSNPNSDWNQGYGFQFWRCRHNAYRGDGAFGQYCVVMPDQDAVVAINSGVKDMQAVLNVIWDKLLPAFQARSLPPNAAGDAYLKATLARLAVRPAAGNPLPANARHLLNRQYKFIANDKQLTGLSLVSTDNVKTLLLKLQLGGRDVAIPCGYQHWERGTAPLFTGALGDFPDEPTAGTFAWLDDSTCALKLCAYETPYHLMLTLKFAGDKVSLTAESNVAFGPTRWPELSGQAE